MPVRFIKPGTVVWFYSNKQGVPMTGTVVRVWNQREANITVLTHQGKVITLYSVRIVHEGDPLPRWGCCYAVIEHPFEPPLLKG